jgi:hypothetical protein
MQGYWLTKHMEHHCPQVNEHSDAYKRLNMRWHSFRARRLRRAPLIHYLHVPKNGGMALRSVFDKYDDHPTAPAIFIRQHHLIRLRHLPRGAGYFFAVRDPVERFFSAFYSSEAPKPPRRNRLGAAKPLARVDKVTIAGFENACDLAEALSAGGEDQLRAEAALHAKAHFRRTHRWFFDEPERLFETRPPLAVLRVEMLNADFERFAKGLGFTNPPEFPKDDAEAHRAAVKPRKPLSDLARRNLEEWYREDIAFVALARQWAEAQ